MPKLDRLLATERICYLSWPRETNETLTNLTSNLSVLTQLTFCIRGGREVAINVGCVWFVSWQTEVKTALSIHPPLHFAHRRVPRPSGPMMHWSRAVAPTSSRGGLVLA